MSKKQIIIDGVDVSGCEDYGYRGSAGYWCHNYDEPCTDYPNCCFKQLKRKEQECEKVKNWVKGMMFYTDCSNWFERFTTAFEDWKNDLTSQLDQLKAENKELKKKVYKYEQAEKYPAAFLWQDGLL